MNHLTGEDLKSLTKQLDGCLLHTKTECLSGFALIEAEWVGDTDHVGNLISIRNNSNPTTHMDKKIKKLNLNKKSIARLTNPEMDSIIGGNDGNCWESRFTCTTTGARTTCKSRSCTGPETGFTCNLSCIPLGHENYQAIQFSEIC